MPAATRLRNLPPGLALAIITVLVLSIAALVAVGWNILDAGAPEHGDLDTYAEVIGKLRAGEPYYLALHDRLLANGYGTLSVFNWRPPFFMSLLALLPSLFFAQLVLCAFAAAAAALACRLVLREAGRHAAVFSGAVLLLGFAACLSPRAALMCELYGGALILLSASAYGLKLPWLGLGAGVLALLFREIAAPYVVICAVLALRERRFAEVALWVAVFVGYGIYFAWHNSMVMSLLGPQDHAYASGWVQYGGASFVLLTGAFNGAFLLFPYWVTALVLPLAVLGLVAWPGQAGARFLPTVLCFLVLFAVVGKPNNSYWGALYTPLLAPGLAFVPAALRDLIAATRLWRVPGPRGSTSSP